LRTLLAVSAVLFAIVCYTNRIYLSMFFTQKHIISISPNAIVVAAVDAGAKRTVTIKKRIPLNKSMLRETLLDIKKSFNGSFDVILGDVFAFVFAVAIPTGTKDEREFVRIKAAEEVPQEITPMTGWDFKEFLKHVDQNEKVVQCVVVENDFYSLFSDAVRMSGISIDAMEPMLCSLARAFEEKPEPRLVLYQEERVIAFVTYRGLVLSNVSFDTTPDPHVIAQLIGFVKKKFDIVPKHVFLAGSFPLSDEMTKALSSYIVERGDLDPFMEMAKKKDGKNDKDTASLNIMPAAMRISGDPKLQQHIVGIAEPSLETGVMSHYERITDVRSGSYPQGKLFTILIFASSFLIILANAMIWYQRLQEERIKEIHPPAVSTGVSETTTIIPSGIATSVTPTSL